MRAIRTIAEREFRALITAPLGYVVILFFLLVSAVFFVAPLQRGLAHMRMVVGNTTIWLVFLLPAITMRLLAEEKKQGSIEILMTSPVTETQVVLGKYLGALGYYLVMLFSTFQFVFALAWVRKSQVSAFFPTYVGLILVAVTLVLLALAALRESRVLGLVTAVSAVSTLICVGFAMHQMGEWGPALTGYIGLLLIGATFLAIGLMTSALTRNQIIAWVSTAAILLGLTVLIGWMAEQLPGQLPVKEANADVGATLKFAVNMVVYGLVQVLKALSLQEYLQNFAMGVLDLRDLVLYLSLIAASLFFAVRGLTTSRWT
ncbi:MAG: hypothetical protein FJX77_01180 [Armatimonadetes bacterium]|nr:hypothetical protein [Armatimonadota bacterium]